MKKFLSGLTLVLGGLLVFALCFYIGMSLTETTPKVAKFITGINSWEYQVQEQTMVYYSDGTEMGRLGYKREYREDFPQLLKEAVVAVEDKRFYQHKGFDAKSIGRAVWNNLKAGRKAEGGSTITQQLARTLFLNQEKTYWRKIKEVFIASAIEDKYTKEAILNMYLNEIYMGRGCSGMECAAESYFGKSVADLNNGEITALAGIIQSPEYYTAKDHGDALKLRQQTVVDLLVKQGTITSAEGERIMQQKLNIKPFTLSPYKHPYYMAYLANQLESMLGAQRLYQGGLKIYTTLDSRMQPAAETAVKTNAKSFSSRGITAQDVALVSVDPQTGAIRAMVGGVDWDKNQINMAVAPRQPGSAIKPLYYAAAINEGIIDPDTVLNNKPRSFNGYRPVNYSSSPEKVTARQALVYSYNVASVEVLNMLGVETAARYLTDYGITSLEDGDKNLSLALGGMTRGISPLQIAAAYAVFPAQGKHNAYYTIEKIIDARNKIVYVDSSASNVVIDTDTAAHMNSMLRDVVSYGTGTSARISISSGGKTGTTTDSRDLWYLGYTSELSTAVWAGNSDNKPVKGYGTYGGTVCGPIWRDYMNSLIYAGVLKEGAPPPVVEESDDSIPADESIDYETNPAETLPENGQDGGQIPPLQPPDNNNTGGQPVTTRPNSDNNADSGFNGDKQPLQPGQNDKNSE